ncbi:MAG: hypothetical protein AAF685_01380 [Cyanobacteria bacterium P01_C01_bin.89]
MLKLTQIVARSPELCPRKDPVNRASRGRSPMGTQRRLGVHQKITP